MPKSVLDFDKRGAGGKIENYLPEQNAQRILQIASSGSPDNDAIHNIVHSHNKYV